MIKIISAKEARTMRNNANENKEKLLEIQDRIIKEIEKEDGRDWININKISDTNFKILTSLGYSIKKHHGNAYEQIDGYYTISWISR